MDTQNSFTFPVILAGLSRGQEIEFSYQGKTYSITNDSRGSWNFCCDTDEQPPWYIGPFEDRSTLLSFARQHTIAGTPLAEIFDNMLYEEGSVCIL